MMTPYKEVFWQQWGEKTQINRKKSLAEPGSGRGGGTMKCCQRESDIKNDISAFNNY